MQVNPSLSIIIPAFNEQSRLPETLRAISAYLEESKWASTEIIVVDDGSTDQTVKVAESCSSQHARIQVLENPGNKGKGYSIRRGMLSASGDWRLFTDADLSTPIEELNQLYQRAQDGADIVIGSRAANRDLIAVRQPLAREIAGKMFNLAMRHVTGLELLDTQCGFKLFRGETVDSIFSKQVIDGFGFDAETLFIARLLNLQIAEVPVRWSNAEGSKVGILNGFQPFVDLFRIRKTHRRGLYHYGAEGKSSILSGRR